MSASVTVIWLPVTFLPSPSPLVDATASLICTHSERETISWATSADRPLGLAETKGFPAILRFPCYLLFASLFPSFFVALFLARGAADTRRGERATEKRGKMENSGNVFGPQPVEYTGTAGTRELHSTKAAHDRGHRSLRSFTLHSTYHKQGP